MITNHPLLARLDVALAGIITPVDVELRLLLPRALVKVGRSRLWRLRDAIASSHCLLTCSVC